MAHKTLIGGTGYEVSGGKTLVGGTGYDISGGKTLVGGTAEDIKFSALTDLTGTYWKLEYVTTSSTISYSIEYTNRTGASLTTFYYPMRLRTTEYYYGVNASWVYYGCKTDGATWGFELYSSWTYSYDAQYINITGGTDAMNSTLIAYLQANATQCDSSWNPL